MLLTLSSLKLISGTVIELESGNENVDRHAHYQRDRCAHKQMDGQDTNFKNNLAQAMPTTMVLNRLVEASLKLESGKQNKNRCVHAQNGQTDGHQFENHPSSGGFLSLC